MSDSIRVWSVEGGALAEIHREPVGLESRLENWMDSDIGVLSDDLLVIGRQLDTEGGGTLDLLCLDRAGDIVVVELKRGRTPREVVAQVLDYAAWAAELSYDEVVRIGDGYHGEGLAAAFGERFGTGLPDVLNADHQLLVVASEVDLRSERIIRYLSETHGVSINAVTFNYFRAADGRELLARTHLIEPDVAEDQPSRRSRSKRRPGRSLEDHRADADRRGVVDLFDQVVEGLSRWYRPGPLKTMVSLGRRGAWKSVVNVVTTESDVSSGLRFNVYKHRLADDFGLTPGDVRALLPDDAEPWVYSTDAAAPDDNEWAGFTGTFRTAAEVGHFLADLADAPRQPTA